MLAASVCHVTYFHIELRKTIQRTHGRINPRQLNDSMKPMRPWCNIRAWWLLVVLKPSIQCCSCLKIGKIVLCQTKKMKMNWERIIKQNIARDKYKAFRIPMVVLPATISNNVPGIHINF